MPDPQLDAVYQPGTAVAVVGSGVWLLAALPADHAAVPACWEAARGADPVDAILEALLADGVRRAPDFALVSRDPAGWRVVVRGAGKVALHGPGGDRMLAAESGSTWRDLHVADDEAAGLELTVGHDAAAVPVTLPLSAGVLMAYRLRLGNPSAARPTAETSVLDAATTPTPAAVAQSAPEPEPEPTPAPPPADEPDDDTPTYDHLWQATPVADEAPTVVVAVPAQPAEPDVLGLTQPPPVDEDWQPAAAVDPPATKEPGLITSLPFALDAAAPAQRPLESPVSWSPPAPSGAPLHWSPPATDPEPLAWSPPAPVPPAAPEPPSPAMDDDLLQTVNRAALRAPAVPGPTVLAARCPAGHASPANASHCRVCGVPVPPQQAVEIPRPVLGRLALSVGGDVRLDKNAVLGRSPQPTGTGERPNLVQIKDPAGDMSRTHLEVVLEGWHVLVRDLGSTNGTEVTLPGEQPVRLRPNDLLAIEPGTLVTLGGSVTMRYEVTG